LKKISPFRDYSISNTLKNLFLVLVVLFILHGVEEYLTGFYKVDLFFMQFFSFFEVMPWPQAAFLLFQALWWLILVIVSLFVFVEKWSYYAIAIIGLIALVEIHHVYKALAHMTYYPGLFTSLLIVVVGIFFLKELFTYKVR